MLNLFILRRASVRTAICRQSRNTWCIQSSLLREFVSSFYGNFIIISIPIKIPTVARLCLVNSICIKTSGVWRGEGAKLLSLLTSSPTLQRWICVPLVQRDWGGGEDLTEHEIKFFPSDECATIWMVDYAERADTPQLSVDWIIDYLLPLNIGAGI